ncbi:MAG: hypothetical protein ACI8RP_001140 [Urechidicola sp.]|jgi:hypothetical protein
MLNNKLRSFLLIGLFGVLSGCSRSSSSNSIYDIFLSFGTAISNLIMNPFVVFGFMFFAMLIGTFAMFKGLLRFSFAKGFGESTFGAKEINVIALMLSIIGTTGIFFIFRTDPSGLISLFGGSVGLLFVLFICTLIMQYFLNFAKSFENPEGVLGKGAGWISVVVLGAVFSLFLLVGYAGQVLKSLGCRVIGVTGDVVCSSLSQYNIFLGIYNNGSTILSWLIFIGLIFFLMSFKKKGGEDEPAGKKSSLPSISEDEKENKGKVTEVKKLMVGFSDSLNSAREAAKDKEKALVALQNALRGR